MNHALSSISDHSTRIYSRNKKIPTRQGPFVFMCFFLQFCSTCMQKKKKSEVRNPLNQYCDFSKLEFIIRILSPTISPF